jgi:hypothetical protein
LYSVVPFPPLTVWLADVFWQAAMTLRAGMATKKVTAIAMIHRVHDTNHPAFLRNAFTPTCLCLTDELMSKTQAATIYRGWYEIPDATALSPWPHQAHIC